MGTNKGQRYQDDWVKEGFGGKSSPGPGLKLSEQNLSSYKDAYVGFVEFLKICFVCLLLLLENSNINVEKESNEPHYQVY